MELHRWGTPINFAFEAKEHFDVPAVAAGMDFYTHVERTGLTEVWTPVLVRSEAMSGTGQLPKFAEDSYQTSNGWWLIPTLEVPFTNQVAARTPTAPSPSLTCCA